MMEDNYKILFKLRYVLFLYLAFAIRDLIASPLGLHDGTLEWAIYILITSIILALISFIISGTTKVTRTRISFSMKSTMFFYALLMCFLGVLYLTGTLNDIIFLVQSGTYSIIIAAGVALGAGILEEFLIRVLMFAIILKFFENSKNKFLFTSVSTSFLFGLLHMHNLTEQSMTTTVQQIFYTFVIGIVFSAVRIWFNGITLAVFIHTLMDFKPTIVTGGTGSSNWMTVLIVFLPIAIFGVICLIQLDKDSPNVSLVDNKLNF
ncbi:type II CAAX prenyl endopeptidase Rce1 family protein [Enterococcus faecalis]